MLTEGSEPQKVIGTGSKGEGGTGPHPESMGTWGLPLFSLGASTLDKDVLGC